MPGIDRSLPLRARPVIEPKPMPLRTRLAAAYGDADQAAQLLNEAARGFHLEIERLMVAAEPAETPPAAARRRLMFSAAARNTRRSPALPVAYAP
jgi:hypothetical protein